MLFVKSLWYLALCWFAIDHLKNVLNLNSTNFFGYHCVSDITGGHRDTTG